VDLLNGRKPIGNKWVFKKKLNAKGKVDKYKDRLLTKGYSQVEGIDFGEIFYPISKLTSIRFILSIVDAFHFEVETMDVKTTFLHGDLEEEKYMNHQGCGIKNLILMYWDLASQGAKLITMCILNQ
jgi:hypothetical protein